MTTNNLPDRQAMLGTPSALLDAIEVLDAYQDEVLMTEAEWREAIDYERLMAALDDIVPNFRDSWDFDFFVETVAAAIGEA